MIKMWDRFTPADLNRNFVLGELLGPILRNSPTKDLVRFRGVNKNWRKECDRILLMRKDLEMRLTYCIHSYQMSFVRNCEFRDSGDKLEPKFRCSMENYRLNPNRKPLSELNDLLRDILATRGPYSPFFIVRFRFEFFYGHFESSDLHTFFHLHGQFIRGLSVENYDTYYLGQGGWNTSILRYTPNLDSIKIRAKITEKLFPDISVLMRSRDEQLQRLGAHLSLHQKPSDVNNEPSDDFPSLRNLKTVEVEEYDSYTSLSTRLTLPSFLVLTSPLNGQLNKVHFPSGFNVKMLEMFGPERMKFLSIRKLHLKLILNGKVRDKNLLNLLTLNSVRLENLHLVLYQSPEDLEEWEFIFQFVQKILILNQNSIKQVHLQGAAVQLLRNIEGLPALPRVEKLLVSIEFNKMESAIERFDGFSSESGDVDILARVFPNVKAFDFITHGINQDEAISNVQWFPFWETKLPTVKDVWICTTCTNRFYHINKFPQMFSGVKNLKMSFTSDEFKENAKYLWEMKELESIDIEIFIKADPFNNNNKNQKHFLDFDSAITGINEEQVAEIIRISEETKSWPKKFERLERSASILDLPNLRKLDIAFVLPFIRKGPPYRVLSGVSGKFAFSVMKQLQVNIQVCNNNSNDPIEDLFRPVTCFSNVKLQV